MSSDLKEDILKAKRGYEKFNCKCLKTNYEDEYWGYWLECECGYKNNTDYATYCGGCGRRIHIIGTTDHVPHLGQR